MRPIAEIAAAMPWYDEADPDYTEAIAAINSLLDQHIPSLSDEDDVVIEEMRYNSDVDRFGQPAYDNADLAVRTCRCGKGIDGFYEYVAHLKEVLTT